MASRPECGHERSMASIGQAEPGHGGEQGGEQIDLSLHANHLRVIETGPALRQALVDLIDGARESVKLYYYIFAADDSGRLILDRLIAAQRRGVAVTLMIDAFGSGSTPLAFFDPLVAAGAHFGRFGVRRSMRYLIRNHQKLAIADDRRLLMGGFNVEDGYFGIPAEDCWHDLGLLVEGPQVQAMTSWYGQLWRWVSTRRQRFRTLRRMVRNWHSPIHPVADEPMRWVIGGPTRRLSPWAQLVKHDLEQAGRLDMVEAYFSPGRGMLKRIARAARRKGYSPHPALQVRQWRDRRGGAAALWPPPPARRGDLGISTVQAAHEADRGGRCGLYRLGQFRHAQPVPQPGNHAADRACRLCQGDAGADRP